MGSHCCNKSSAGCLLCGFWSSAASSTLTSAERGTLPPAAFPICGGGIGCMYAYYHVMMAVCARSQGSLSLQVFFFSRRGRNNLVWVWDRVKSRWGSRYLDLGQECCVCVWSHVEALIVSSYRQKKAETIVILSQLAHEMAWDAVKTLFAIKACFVVVYSHTPSSYRFLVSQYVANNVSRQHASIWTFCRFLTGHKPEVIIWFDCLQVGFVGWRGMVGSVLSGSTQSVPHWHAWKHV